MNANIECPECAGAVRLPDNVLEGEVLDCPDCGTGLEVVGPNPLQLALAPPVQEDWGE